MQRLRPLLIPLLALLLLAAPAAEAASPDLVISQVYAGGGNSGATYTNDFVEVFNRGNAAVDLTGWTIQYATAAGTSWSPTALSGSLAPGRHYLVQLASAAAVGAPLPTPDATGTTNLAASGGKIAIADSAAALTCGATAGSCSTAPSVHDLIGYGSASDYEGAGPSSGLSSTTANVRATQGCTDTDSNADDFTTDTPAPRNTSSAAVTCGGGGTLPPSVSQGATVNVDIQQVLSITLEKASVSFGTAAAGQTPAPVGERVTVTSNDAAGYALSVHRSAFTPADLPLGIAATAPAGTQIAPPLAGGGLVAIPITPASDLLLGSSAASSAGGGDQWATSLGFVSALPVVPPGHYAATVTYTVIGR